MLLSTNSKLYMPRQLTQQPMTLSDLEFNFAVKFLMFSFLRLYLRLTLDILLN